MTNAKNQVIPSVVWVAVLVIAAFASSDFGSKKNTDQHHYAFQKEITRQ